MADFDIEVPDNVPQSQPTQPQQQAAQAPIDSGVDLPDVEVGSKSVNQYVVEPDAKELAVKFGIIGAGQGGSRLADTFYQIGYRRVCAINTTAQDFLGLTIPAKNQMVLLENEGGAGKCLDKGAKALTSSSEEVMNLMRHSFGEDIDRILITAGLGGGCVSLDTNILTSDGLMTAGAIFSNYAEETPCEEGQQGEIGYALTQELKVASFKSGAVEWKPLDRVWAVPEKPGITITTRYGSLTCSENHPVFVYDNVKDELVEKAAKDVNVSDVVYHYQGNLDNGIDYEDKDYLWLLGYFAGNGNFKWAGDRLHSIRFYDECVENLEKVKSIVLTNGATSATLSPHALQSSFELYAYGGEFINKLTGVFGRLRPIKGNLILPEFVYNLNKPSFLAFLTGVHSADGYVRANRNSIDLAMIDVPFVEGLRDLCLIHGLRATYSLKTSVRVNERPLGRLRIFEIDQKTKAEISAHLTEPLRQELMRSETNMSLGYKSNENYPLSYNQISRMVSVRPKPSDYVRGSYGISRGRFSDEYASSLDDGCLLKKIHKHLYAVKSVEKSESMKFIDFTVADNSNYFAGNGALTLVHNSGSGCVGGLIKLAKYYFRQLGKPEKVGVIVSLPKYSEGGKVQENAYNVLKSIQPLVDDKTVSPFIITDNESINQMFPNVSAKQFWSTANKNTVGLFDIFNVLACQKSQYSTFDKADYQSILDSGTIIFGATKLDSYQKDTDLSDGLRANLKRTLLADADITKASCAAAILCAPDQILGILPQSHIDLAFTTLERILGGENRGLMVHQGVYEAKKMGLFIYTMVGGLPIPEQRLNIMKARAGIDLK